MNDTLKIATKVGLAATGIALITLFLMTSYLTLKKSGLVDSGCEVRVTGEMIDLLVRCDQGLTIENTGDANVTITKKTGQ